MHHLSSSVRRASILSVALLSLLGSVAVVGRAEASATLPVKSLVIDTGVNGLHPEFGDGQIFGWWDFSGASADPTPDGLTWQDRDGDGHLQGDRDDPYDPHGHGSGTASMLAGRNLHASKTPSACPGCPIAVAKVQNERAENATGEALDGSIPNAILWGVDVLDVDVISISIGSLAPLPRQLNEGTYAAISHARANGVLVVFANGNGWGNAGGPGQPGGFMNYGNSTDALSVGADGRDSFFVTTDPEVVAVFRVVAARRTGSSYGSTSGTSFSAPFAAGAAARLIGEGRACGTSHSLEPDAIERLLKVTARDRADVPPSFEGYGIVDLTTTARARGVLCNGDATPAPDPVNDAYVTYVSGTQRSVSSAPLALGTLRESALASVSPALALGTSAPTGARDAEVFRIVVGPGQTLQTVVQAGTNASGVAEFDLLLFRGTGPLYNDSARLAAAVEPGDREALEWTNLGPTPVTVSLVVAGWAVVGELPFTITGFDPAATRVFDGYLVG